MRMPEKDYDILQAMSLLTNKSMAELVREAIIEKVNRFVESDVERQIEEDVNKRQAALRLMRENLAS
jgi:predicted DNA-binding protein